MRRALPLVIAAGAFASFAILWIVSDRRASQRIYDKYSSANTSEKGLSLAAGYLAKQRKVAMLTRPIARAELEPNAVVFRVVDRGTFFFDPEDLEGEQVGPPRPRRQPVLNDAEEAFVRGGGRMILAAPAGPLDTVAVKANVARKVFPIWPRVGNLDLSADARGFSTLRARMHALYASGTHAVVARERIGGGELFLISDPALFQNDGLARGNHLPLLSALAGSGRPVYFDEVPHGIVSGDGSLALLKTWNLGPFLLLLGAIALLVFWRAGRRVGPAEDDHRETRSDAVDLVRSLGALYQKVTTDAEAIALYHEALTRTVASKTGLRGDALRKRVDDLTGGLVPPDRTANMPAPIFRRDLDKLNEGFERVVESSSRRVAETRRPGSSTTRRLEDSKTRKER